MFKMIWYGIKEYCWDIIDQGRFLGMRAVATRAKELGHSKETIIELVREKGFDDLFESDLIEWIEHILF